MDLVKWRNRYGQSAVAALFEAAGFSVQYRQAVMNAFKPISLQRAQVLARLEPQLDVLALVNQHLVILALKAERGKKWRTDKTPNPKRGTKRAKPAITTKTKTKKKPANGAIP
jgi:hypothetical protein